jgi:hypothetical protein
MATYTLNTTAAQETIITRARTEANNVQGAEQFATNGAYLLDVLTDKLTEIWQAQKVRDKAGYEDALAIATQAQKDQIAAILGLPSGTLAPVKA